jgi:hypothetical protein
MPPLYDEKGRILCADCGGNGCIEGSYGHPDDPHAEIIWEDCDACHGTGLRPCDGCPAGEARIVGEDGIRAHCSTRCAFEAENYPACLACGAEAQDPEFAPFGSGACESRMLSDIQRHQLDRWLKRVRVANAADPEVHA